MQFQQWEYNNQYVANLNDTVNWKFSIVEQNQFKL